MIQKAGTSQVKFVFLW